MIPECLKQQNDLYKALNAAEDLRSSLLDRPGEQKLEDAVAFIDQEIQELKRQISSLDDDVDKVFSILQEHGGSTAYSAAWLYYKCGMKWNEVAEFLGKSPEATKMTAYRMFDQLEDKGLI